MQSAEVAYLFRHALLRDAAYELQLPADRARLHTLAASVLEQVHADDQALESVAGAISDHLQLASEMNPGPTPGDDLRRFTLLGARYARSSFDHSGVIRLNARMLQIGTPEEVAQSLHLLYTWTRQFKGDIQGAQELALKLLRHSRKHGFNGLVATALHQLASHSAPERAYRLNRRAFRVASRIRDWVPAGIALGNIGGQFARQGDLRRAERYFRRAIAIQRRAGNRVGEGFFLSQLSLALLKQQRVDEALVTADEATRVLDFEDGKSRYLPLAMLNRSNVLLEAGRIEPGVQAAEQAVEVAMRQQDRASELRARMTLAIAICRQGQPDRAREDWNQALAEFDEFGDPDGVGGMLDSMRQACREAGVEAFNLPRENSTHATS